VTILIPDTETTGFVKNYSDPSHPEQPYLVELGAQLVDETGKVLAQVEHIIKPEGWAIPDKVAKVHGITTEMAVERGVPLWKALWDLDRLVMRADMMIFFNAAFDMAVLRAAHFRLNHKHRFHTLPVACLMESLTPIMKILRNNSGYKTPSLQEAHKHFLGAGFDNAHGALVDVQATTRVLVAAWKQQEDMLALRARDRVADWLKESPGNLAMIMQAGERYQRYLEEERAEHQWLELYDKM
jgi:DNA polymerase III epsilon subunit-like protein